MPLLRNRVITLPLPVCEAMDVQHGNTLLEKVPERSVDELARAPENRESTEVTGTHQILTPPSSA